ncbi:MAG: hypothetical protein GX458_14020, partial [Phyllobacteriaceae bacterium]|nr:hypothetical protein [Phyllobacteriaceae bacterium]
MDIRLSEVVFDAAARDAFVALSRDANPVHVDALAARRTAAGVPIVHGVHQ